MRFIKRKLTKKDIVKMEGVFNTHSLNQSKDTQPKLACEKHFRILIGKDKCVDCENLKVSNFDTIKPTDQPKCSHDCHAFTETEYCLSCEDNHQPTDKKPIWEEAFNDNFTYVSGDERFVEEGEVTELIDFFKEVEKAAYERGKKDGLGEAVDIINKGEEKTFL